MNNWLDKLRSVNVYLILVHLTVVVLTVEVFVLAKQNRELKLGGGLQKQVEIRVGDPLSLGDLVPLTSQDPMDSSGNQLLYMFTTTCPFCKQNIRSWEDLNSMALEKHVPVLGICLDTPEKAKRFVAENQITYKVYVPRDHAKFREEQRINSVPATILRTHDGHASRIWMGILHSEQMKEIEEGISVGHSPLINQRRKQ